MPPELDLSHSTHAKIMAVPPRINLRRAVSYNNYERHATAASSSSSSRLNFSHLLFSPPPSPSLPALVPRRKRSPSQIFTSRPSRAVRLVAYLFGITVTIYLLASAFQHKHTNPPSWPSSTGGEYEMIGQDALPDFPTPIIVNDDRGRARWTVSIPRAYDFPLSMKEYADMCDHCREVSVHASGLHNKSPLSEQAILSQDAPEGYFVDIAEAEKAGMLPGAFRGTAPKDTGHFVGLDAGRQIGKPVCQSSMTYVLESTDAGLGSAMMSMWTLFALAKEQGRAFFIDDSRWAYGTYTDIFQLPPIPDCRPPPRHHMVPCPVQARHLVVSSVTEKTVLPALMAKHGRISGNDGSRRDQLELARIGYHFLFALNTDDGSYVEARIEQLTSKAKSSGTASANAPIIGLHIRHGDRHPLEYQYKDTYIPAEVFLRRAQNLVEEYYNETAKDATSHRALTLIASDDPVVHNEPEFAEALVAQERIRLASKELIDEVNPNPHVLHRFVDESFGWEGGFFASMFWNLGKPQKNNAANAPDGVNAQDLDSMVKSLAPPSEDALKLRSFMGRAYMLDLAVLAGASDKIVCTVSAMGCRLLGVMMGWEEGMANGRWVNVDGAYGWAGISW